tara:strand:+ start:158 stop:1210 length:1053 start_codon:yes stop_codon:yes gene_type:complete
MKGKIMLDTNDIMGTSTHTLPETKVHKNLKDLSLFDFGVQEVPLHYYFESKDINGNDVGVERVAEGKKAIIRSDTGDFIGNHSNKYKTVPHYSLYKKHVEKLLDNKNIDTDNVDIIDATWDNGAKARRTIHFNSHDYKVKDGDIVQLRTDIFNSLDGSWAFQTFTGAYRSLCLNTLVFGGQKFYHERRKHTGGLSIASALSKINGTLDVFETQGDKFKLWSNAKVTDNQVAKLLADTVAYKKSRTVETLKDLDKTSANINTRLSDYLLYRYEQEQGSLGKTLWALYNAVTHWSTHTDETWETVNKKGEVVELSTGRKGSQKANVQKEREIAVRNMLDSDSWKNLEDLAVA